MTLRNFLFGFGVLAILLTLFPFVPIEHWSVRMFDFPQLQLTLLTLLAFAAYWIKFRFSNWRDYTFAGILLVCVLIQGYRLLPFTAFAPLELLNASEQSSNSIKLYNANVLQKNDRYEDLYSDISAHDPDIVLLLETNAEWQGEMDERLSEKYPHSIKQPLDNTYGMLLYSKRVLLDAGVQFMVEDTIPSIHAKVLSRSNDTIQLIAIHPTPPIVMHAKHSFDRDAEMMMAARKAYDSNFPVIVLGDFNDVSWSGTNELFKKVSKLLDPRKGRGLFNTFNAKNWIFRWPLDHIFCSAEFRLLDIKRGSKFGSDHYPFYLELSLEPEKADEQKPKPPTEEELKRAFDQLEEERKHSGE